MWALLDYSLLICQEYNWLNVHVFMCSVILIIGDVVFDETLNNCEGHQHTDWHSVSSTVLRFTQTGERSHCYANHCTVTNTAQGCPAHKRHRRGLGTAEVTAAITHSVISWCYRLSPKARDGLGVKNGPGLFDSDRPTKTPLAIHHHPRNPYHTLCNKITEQYL